MRPWRIFEQLVTNFHVLIGHEFAFNNQLIITIHKPSQNEHQITQPLHKKAREQKQASK